MPTLRICLFGGLAVGWDREALPAIPSAAARSLLAYLVCHRGRPHTRDLLAGTFWPDLPDTTARQRLSQALWHIRRTLAPHPVLLAEGDTIQFNPELPLWLDVAEFEQQASLAMRGERPAPPGSGTSDARELDAVHSSPPGILAADLYQGEFLPGYYDDWVLLERERLREMLLAVLERLITRFKGQREYERALACARRLAAEDPWREEAHREVMRLCHLLGRDADALKQFELCRQALAQDLDSRPSGQTVALAAEVAARSGLPTPPFLPSLARPGTAPLLDQPDRLPLVGRESELADLLRHVEMACAGHGGLVVLHGEAGVGKSRLLRELAGNARWRGFQVAWGTCYELGAPLAYQPLVEILRASLPALGEATFGPPWRATLAHLLPELVGTSLPPSLAPDEERRRLLEALARAFLALAQTAPHLLLIEDAHWIDGASLEAVRYLLPRLDAARLLIVVSLRPEELAGQAAANLSAIENTRLARRLFLGRLGRDETGELVQRALDLAQPAPRFSARLYTETEGNPFFLIETLRELMDEGLLYRDQAGVWSTPWDVSTQDYAELPLAAGVAQSVERRLARMPASLDQLLGLASVVGRDVALAVWQAASGRDEQAVLSAGDKLCARGLLVPAEAADSGQGNADYRFAHDLIRRVAYQRLAPARRRVYHRQVAEALSRLAPDEPAALAYHWVGAKDWAKAAGYHHQAGDRARAVYANAEAIGHYSQALAALEQQSGPPDLAAAFELRLAREALLARQGDRAAQATDLAALEGLAAAQALGDGGRATLERQAQAALRWVDYATATGDYPGAVQAAGRAIELAATAEDRDIQATAYLSWGNVLWHQGSYEEARARFEHALDLAGTAGPEAASGRVVADSQLGLGRVFLSQGHYALARDHFVQALELYRQVGEAWGQAEALVNLGTLTRVQGDYLGARDYFERALHLFSQIGDRQGESRALHCLGSVSTNQGDHDQAGSYYERALSIAGEIGHRELQSSLLSALGVLSNRACQYGRARAYLERALDICREIGDRRGQVIALTNLGIVLCCQGDYGGATSYAEEARQLGREIGDRRFEGWAVHTLGRLLAQQGDYRQAQAFYRQGLHISQGLSDRQLECVLLNSLSLVAHLCGDDVRAQECAQQALTIAGEIGEPVDMAYALNNLGHALAGLGCLEEARGAYGRAAELRRGLGQHSLAAESLAGLARVCLEGGDVAQALAQVDEILAGLETGSPDGADEPLRVLLTCYQVLLAAHDPRAEPILAAAHDLLQQRAARSASEPLRRSFLENVPAHRALVAARQERQAASPTGAQPHCLRVLLPRTGTPQGRSLRDDEYVPVDWTVAAPEDEALPDEVARRRHRILRLLREAQAAGAVPRDQDLAAALEISLRTLRRDLAALRAEGQPLPPRRRVAS